MLSYSTSQDHGRRRCRRRGRRCAAGTAAWAERIGVLCALLHHLAALKPLTPSTSAPLPCPVPPAPPTLSGDWGMGPPAPRWEREHNGIHRPREACRRPSLSHALPRVPLSLSCPVLEVHPWIAALTGDIELCVSVLTASVESFTRNPQGMSLTCQHDHVSHGRYQGGMLTRLIPTDSL